MFDIKTPCTCCLTFGEKDKYWSYDKNCSGICMAHCSNCGKEWKIHKSACEDELNGNFWALFILVLIVSAIAFQIFFQHIAPIETHSPMPQFYRISDSTIIDVYDPTIRISYDFPMMGGRQSDYTNTGIAWDLLKVEELQKSGQLAMWNPNQLCGHATITGGGYPDKFGAILLPFFALFFLIVRIVLLIIYRKKIEIDRIWSSNDWVINFFMLGVLINGFLFALGNLFLFIDPYPNPLTFACKAHTLGMGAIGTLLNLGLAFGLMSEYDIYKEIE